MLGSVGSRPALQAFCCLFFFCSCLEMPAVTEDELLEIPFNAPGLGSSVSAEWLLQSRVDYWGKGAKTERIRASQS